LRTARIDNIREQNWRSKSQAGLVAGQFFAHLLGAVKPKCLKSDKLKQVNGPWMRRKMPMM